MSEVERLARAGYERWRATLPRWAPVPAWDRIPLAAQRKHIAFAQGVVDAMRRP